MKKVGVVILNYNGSSDTIDCLKSLLKTDFLGYKLVTIVVDNGSRHEMRVMLKNFVSDFKKEINKNGKEMEIVVIENEKNMGFAEGNNIGIKYVLKQGCEYVIILNNDTIAEENFIKRLLRVFESDKSIGAASPKIYFEKGREFHKDKYKDIERGKVIWYAGGIMDWKNVIASHRGVDQFDTKQYDGVEETDFVTGCCVMIKKEVFDKIGFFDNKYYLYYEDNDFSQRVESSGYKVLFVPDAVVWHKNAGSAGGSGSFLQDYYITRNRMLFGMKYAPLRSKIALLKQSLKLLLSGRKYQKKGIIDYYLANFGKGSM